LLGSRFTSAPLERPRFGAFGEVPQPPWCSASNDFAVDVELQLFVRGVPDAHGF